VVVPGPQVMQLELLLAGPPADHVPGPHSPQDGPANPGLQPAVSAAAAEFIAASISLPGEVR
jgi:hypothetical protein